MKLKQAPHGQFRVVGHDDFRDEGWMKGDYPDIGKARAAATTGSRVLFKIFDDTGKCVKDG